MKLYRKSAITLAGLTALSLVATSHAQQFDDAESLPFGGFDVTPTLDLGLKYDDNVTRADENEISSWSRIISPQVRMDAALGASQVTFAYRLRNEDFFSSKEDNYTDHFFLAQADMELNSRHRVIATLNFEDGHEARGSNFSIGTGQQLTEPDQYKQSELDILYSYGAFNSRGRLDINVDFTELDYDIDTPTYRARDREFADLSGTFYYRIGAVTDAVLEVGVRSVDYRFALNPNNPLDSDESYVLVGLEWEATAQTSGFAKIGYQQKDFESEFRDDFDGFDWELGVLWEPVDYSSLEFITRADTDETNGEGNFIDRQQYRVEWRHEWLERLRTSVQFGISNDEYKGQFIDGLDTRSDDNKRFRASAYYKFRRWLKLEFSYTYDERDSNRLGIDYGRNQYLLNALITL